MRLLGLDVGTRRTGVSFYDPLTDIVLPLSTLHHETSNELTEAVMKLVAEKHIDEIIIGLPLLPSGEEGLQSKHSAEVAAALHEKQVHVTLFDERYTSAGVTPGIDTDAASAVALLGTYVSSKKKNL